MLSSLHISHYILIDSLDITFPEGLVIITGQTGAGKSILLGALSLLSGTKADASLISEGAESCVVEAEFDGADDAVKAMLEENEVEWDGGHLIIRRVIHSSGRSRSFINDTPVPVTLLQDISDRLIDIHSQHRSLLLTDRNFQLQMLDFFAGNTSRLASCKESWQKLQSMKSELATLKSKLGKILADSEYNAARFKELDLAQLKAGELEALETEQKSLANAEQIKESLASVLNTFEPGEDNSLSASLKEARRQLEAVAKYIPSASELAQRLDSARIELADIEDEVSFLDSKVDVSPDHLAEVEDRMSLLYSLLKKHGCRTIEELIAVREELSETLFDSTALQEKLSDLEKAIKDEYGKYRDICDALSASRKKAAPRYAEEILSSLRFLELDRSVFEVRTEDAPESASGCDRVEYLFSSTGARPVDVAKCASGGEISRIMLSLKAMMARFTGMPTLIFDEIDTGVSGSVADKMGSMVCSMGNDMQIFSITHLPQVAAKGDAHYVVSKNVDGSGRTTSSIRKVSGNERVHEIARLLSGAVISSAAIANAEALLNGN